MTIFSPKFCSIYRIQPKNQADRSPGLRNHLDYNRLNLLKRNHVKSR